MVRRSETYLGQTFLMQKFWDLGPRLGFLDCFVDSIVEGSGVKNMLRLGAVDTGEFIRGLGVAGESRREPTSQSGVDVAAMGGMLVVCAADVAVIGAAFVEV